MATRELPDRRSYQRTFALADNPYFLDEVERVRIALGFPRCGFSDNESPPEDIDPSPAIDEFWRSEHSISRTIREQIRSEALLAFPPSGSPASESPLAGMDPPFDFNAFWQSDDPISEWIRDRIRPEAERLQRRFRVLPGMVRPIAHFLILNDERVLRRKTRLGLEAWAEDHATGSQIWSISGIDATTTKALWMELWDEIIGPAVVDLRIERHVTKRAPRTPVPDEEFRLRFELWRHVHALRSARPRATVAEALRDWERRRLDEWTGSETEFRRIVGEMDRLLRPSDCD